MVCPGWLLPVHFFDAGHGAGHFRSFTTYIANDLGVGQSTLSLTMTCEMLGIALAMPPMNGMIRKANLKRLALLSVLALGVLVGYNVAVKKRAATSENA